MGKDDENRSRKEHKKRKKKKSRKRLDERDDSSSHDSPAASDDRRHRKKRSKRSKKENKKEKADHQPKGLFDLGPIYDRLPAKILSADDYFDFHKHLWLFLFRTKGLIFDELSSQETRRYFKDFIQKYNAGKLPTAYYDSNLPRQALDECQTTRHKWGINVSKELELLQSSVYEQTEQGLKQSKDTRRANSYAASSSILDQADPSTNDQPSHRPIVGPMRPPTNDVGNNDLSRRRSRFDRAGEREKLDLRERRLLEKKLVSERTHAAHRDRDAVELTDDVVYGGDSTDFQRALEQEKRRNAARLDRKTSRIQELKQKEAQKEKEMMERLGLTKR